MDALLTTPERVAIARLHALLELLPAALDKRLGAAGVTAFEYTLLETLSEAERTRMRLSALAAKTNASLPGSRASSPRSSVAVSSRARPAKATAALSTPC
ncbi:hypothetical protein [Leucobacter soli]|uniref:hypothetical protein n=1 Tax=Leucobacter soli TaxID=2812850 RepID=UPI003610695D